MLQLRFYKTTGMYLQIHLDYFGNPIVVFTIQEELDLLGDYFGNRGGISTDLFMQSITYFAYLQLMCKRFTINTLTL